LYNIAARWKGSKQIVGLKLSTIASAAADGSVRERPVERGHRAPAWPELPAEARAALTSLMTQLILNHAATTEMAPAKEVSHDL
jgi:hypothetical protein